MDIFDVSQLADNDFMLDDTYINELAKSSNVCNDTIEEFKINGKYSMILTKADNTKSILISIADGEVYKKASKYFFDRFVDYGGSMHIALE